MTLYIFFLSTDFRSHTFRVNRTKRNDFVVKFFFSNISKKNIERFLDNSNTNLTFINLSDSNSVSDCLVSLLLSLFRSVDDFNGKKLASFPTFFLPIFKTNLFKWVWHFAWKSFPSIIDCKRGIRKWTEWERERTLFFSSHQSFGTNKEWQFRFFLYFLFIFSNANNLSLMMKNKINHQVR